MSDALDISKLELKVWDVDQPKDSRNNNKTHTKESVEKLAKSMNSLGQLQPILVDRDGVIIAGHGRRMAAKQLGWAKIKVIQLDVDETTARKMRLADNRTFNDNFDADAIARELKELSSLGEDLEALGDSVGLSDQQIAMLVPDLAGVFDNIDENVVSNDLSKDVIAFSEENEKITAEIEASDVRAKDALGFDKVTPAQARTLKRFMAEIIAETGIEQPAAALVAWAEEIFQ